MSSITWAPASSTPTVTSVGKGAVAASEGVRVAAACEVTDHTTWSALPLQGAGRVAGEPRKISNTSAAMRAARISGSGMPRSWWKSERTRSTRSTVCRDMGSAMARIWDSSAAAVEPGAGITRRMPAVRRRWVSRRLYASTPMMPEASTAPAPPMVWALRPSSASRSARSSASRETPATASEEPLDTPAPWPIPCPRPTPAPEVPAPAASPLAAAVTPGTLTTQPG